MKRIRLLIWSSLVVLGTQACGSEDDIISGSESSNLTECKPDKYDTPKSDGSVQAVIELTDKDFEVADNGTKAITITDLNDSASGDRDTFSFKVADKTNLANPLITVTLSGTVEDHDVSIEYHCSNGDEEGNRDVLEKEGKKLSSLDSVSLRASCAKTSDDAGTAIVTISATNEQCVPYSVSIDITP